VRRDRPSTTAALVAAVRALYSELPPPYRLAPDQFAAALVPRWLALPARVARRFPDAAPLLHGFASVVGLGMAENVALRTRAIDDALRAGVAAGARQVVLLGAGLDSRAHRIPELSALRVLEVDHPSTHRYKAARLARLSGAAREADTVRVPIDFERDRLDDVLTRAGLVRDELTFWIWEGVTVYLSRAALLSTLRVVGELSAPGSRLAVTYTRPGARRGPRWIEPVVPLLGSIVGEPIRGMIDTAALEGLLGDVGFSRLSDESAADWGARHWPGEPPRREWERLMIAARA
jgi:methyltransferase (TIGR00027 family)